MHKVPAILTPSVLPPVQAVLPKVPTLVHASFYNIDDKCPDDDSSSDYHDFNLAERQMLQKIESKFVDQSQLEELHRCEELLKMIERKEHLERELKLLAHTP